MELRAGTSGSSYPARRGHFYPEKIKPAEMLAFYAERLPAVEIHNTFYRLPRASVGSLVATAPAAYLRLRRSGYSIEELASWYARIRGAGCDEAFVFFKHEEEGAGPRMALELLDHAGRERERKPAVASRASSSRASEAG